MSEEGRYIVTEQSIPRGEEEEEEGEEVEERSRGRPQTE